MSTTGPTNTAERISHPRFTLATYRILTLATWALLVVTTLYYSIRAPHDTRSHHEGTIWHINRDYRTPFSLNAPLTAIYFIVLFASQLAYAWQLYRGDEVHMAAAADVGAHFIISNLLLFGVVHLWCRTYMWPALVLVILNFVNLSAAYFRHSRAPRPIHVPVVTGPLALTYVLLFVVGAAAVDARSFPARILANLAVWGILGYGLFFLMVYKDYTMGFNLSVLSAALGAGQFLIRVIALQWIFAFVIMTVLFLLTVATATGNDPFRTVNFVPQDRERAPLLQEA